MAHLMLSDFHVVSGGSVATVAGGSEIGPDRLGPLVSAGAPLFEFTEEARPLVMTALSDWRRSGAEGGELVLHLHSRGVFDGAEFPQVAAGIWDPQQRDTTGRVAVTVPLSAHFRRLVDTVQINATLAWARVSDGVPNVLIVVPSGLRIRGATDWSAMIPGKGARTFAIEYVDSHTFRVVFDQAVASGESGTVDFLITYSTDDAAIVTFEEFTHLAQAWSSSEQGFTTTGSLVVQDGMVLYGSPNAGADFSQKWMGTQYLVPTTGFLGSILADNGVMRVMGMQAWTSANGGDNFAIGDVTFEGVLANGSIVTDVITVTPTGNSGGSWDRIEFTNIAAVNIAELRVTLPGGLNYIGMDNIEFGLIE